MEIDSIIVECKLCRFLQLIIPSLYKRIELRWWQKNLKSVEKRTKKRWFYHPLPLRRSFEDGNKIFIYLLAVSYTNHTNTDKSKNASHCIYYLRPGNLTIYISRMKRNFKSNCSLFPIASQFKHLSHPYLVSSYRVCALHPSNEM